MGLAAMGRELLSNVMYDDNLGGDFLAVFFSHSVSELNARYDFVRLKVRPSVPQTSCMDFVSLDLGSSFIRRSSPRDLYYARLA